MHPPNTVYSHLSMAIKYTVRHMHREARCEENLLTASSSTGLPLPDIWRPDVSANNLANVQLNLGRTMGILTHSSIFFFFFIIFHPGATLCLLLLSACCLPKSTSCRYSRWFGRLCQILSSNGNQLQTY